MNTKIIIGIPCNRNIRPRTVASLMNLDNRHDCEFIVASSGFTTSENRNYLAIQTLNRDCDYLFSVDDDMVFPSDTLHKMLKLDKDVVGVMANQKKLPLKSTVEPLDEVSAEPFPCKAVGGGILLIKADVFRKVDTPWFDTKVNSIGNTTVGEDTHFCDKVRNIGLEVWCDPTIEVKHLGDYEY